MCFFPRFYSSSPVERRSAATRGGSRKETLNHRRLAARHAKMAAAPLGFKVPGKACVLPGGARAAALAPSLLPSAGRPARLTEPLSTPTTAVRPAGCPSAGPGGGKGSGFLGSSRAKSKGSAKWGADHPAPSRITNPHSPIHPHSIRAHRVTSCGQYKTCRLNSS